MNFNSPIFLFVFFPLFFIVYFLVPRPGKLLVGILGSLLFYAWGDVAHLPLLLGLIVFSYALGLVMDRWRDRGLAVFALWVGIFGIVSLLLGLKIRDAANYPLGFSYLTFQAIAYLIEVHTGKAEVENNILHFSFYLLLFPKIPVGPIVRYSTVREQIHTIQIDSAGVANGIRRFIIGLAKKVLIADTLARVVTPIFNLSTPSISPPAAWLVLISYALQLYFDFSGFADMAIGMGGMMGFRFVENFNHPYISQSIGDFWRRWHISLSSWFRDFVFYPLERRRLRVLGQPINILIVFLLTGLWHGTALNFVIWGLIHGSALVFESTFLGRKLRTLWVPVQHLYALGVILIGWVFFRSPTSQYAIVFLRRLIGDTTGVKTLPFELTSPLPFIEPTFVMALAAGIVLSLPVGQWVAAGYKKIVMERAPVEFAFQLFRDTALIFILIFTIAAMASSTFSPGIYEAF